MRSCFLRLYITNSNNFRVWSEKIIRHVNKKLAKEFEDEIQRIERATPRPMELEIREEVEEVVVRRIIVVKDKLDVLGYMASTLEMFPFGELFGVTQTIHRMLPSPELMFEEH